MRGTCDLYNSKMFHLKLFKHYRQINEINHELESSQIKIKSLEESILGLKEKISDAEGKVIAAEENLNRQQSSHSLGEIQHSLTENRQRSHSPAVSAEVNSLEDGLCGSIDWHQVHFFSNTKNFHNYFSI